MTPHAMHHAIASLTYQQTRCPHCHLMQDMDQIVTVNHPQRGVVYHGCYACLMVAVERLRTPGIALGQGAALDLLRMAQRLLTTPCERGEIDVLCDAISAMLSA